MTDPLQSALTVIAFVLVFGLALALAYARDLNDDITYTVEEVREPR